MTLVLLCYSSLKGLRRCDGKIADVSHDINGDQGEPCYDGDRGRGDRGIDKENR